MHVSMLAYLGFEAPMWAAWDRVWSRGLCGAGQGNGSLTHRSVLTPPWGAQVGPAQLVHKLGMLNGFAALSRVSQQPWGFLSVVQCRSGVAKGALETNPTECSAAPSSYYYGLVSSPFSLLSHLGLLTLGWALWPANAQFGGRRIPKTVCGVWKQRGKRWILRRATQMLRAPACLPGLRCRNLFVCLGVIPHEKMKLFQGKCCQEAGQGTLKLMFS